VDYYIGYNYIGATFCDSILDEPMEVTGVGVAQTRAGKEVRAGRVWPSLFRDRLSIDVPEPDDVRILDAGGRLVRSLRVERTGGWDGRDEYGCRVPAGAYLVRGRHVSAGVAFVD